MSPHIFETGSGLVSCRWHRGMALMGALLCGYKLPPTGEWQKYHVCLLLRFATGSMKGYKWCNFLKYPLLNMLHHFVFQVLLFPICNLYPFVVPFTVLPLIFISFLLFLSSFIFLNVCNYFSSGVKKYCLHQVDSDVNLYFPMICQPL